MIVKRGDIIASEYGKGKIVAITESYIIHLVEEGYEVAVLMSDNLYWIPAETKGIDVPDNELEIKNNEKIR